MQQVERNAAQLAEAAIMRAADGQRFIIALSGPPGAGKSTLSEMLVAEFSRRGQTAAIVPMDGFHLDNAVLEARGTLARKGAPFTFDADGYAVLLERLRKTPAAEVAVPVFDRVLDLARAGGRIIAPEHRFLIAEGNYLLLDEEPWVHLADMFDLTVMLKADPGELRRRLVDRWLAHGLDPDQALARALSNDIGSASTQKNQIRKPPKHRAPVVAGPANDHHHPDQEGEAQRLVGCRRELAVERGQHGTGNTDMTAEPRMNTCRWRPLTSLPMASAAPHCRGWPASCGPRAN
jgi:pantothenate kinase